MARCNIESIICSRTSLRGDTDLDLLSLEPAIGLLHFLRATFFNRDFFQSIAQLPVERRRGQRYIEGNVIVLRRQRLQICPDLVRNVARKSSAIGSNNHQIHCAALHQVSRGTVCDDRMLHTVLPQLPGCKFGTLISWSRFSDPHVNRQPAVVSGINRGSRRTIVNKGEPSRVAMREHVDWLSCFLSCELPNEFQSVLPDQSAMLSVFIRNRSGGAQSKRDLLLSVFPFGDVF